MVTVGLNLTIPLSLIGQLFLNAQNPSLVYWIGAGIVFVAFVLVNHESSKEDEPVICIEPDDVQQPNIGNGEFQNDL